MSETPTQPCPFVDCGSSDAFSWNTDGYGKCHSCGEGYPSKKRLETFDWAEERYLVVEKTPYYRREVDSVGYKDIRGLDEDVAQLYGIQNQFDGDELVRLALKWPNGVQYRAVDDSKPKYQFKAGSTINKDLGGPDFNSGSSKRLFLTEGLIDAASLFQVLGKTFPVKALPSSSINENYIKTNYTYLSSFQEIIYGGELDPAGKKVADMLYSAFPEKFYFVPMSKWKDANEFLVNGDGNDLKWAALKPQRYSPENFFCSDSDVEKSILDENPYEYTPTGISGLDYKIRGLVKGGITFIKAKRGMGKTELARFFETAMLRTPDTKIALLHAEEMKSTTYRAMATYELGVNVRTRDDAQENGVSEKDVIKAAKTITDGDRTIIFEMRSDDDPMKVLDYVRLAATVYGAEYVFVDHIQRLAYLSQTGVDGATSMLTALGSRMAQLCKELNIGVIFISQVNDDGRTKYAAALEEEAIICIQLNRDTESEDEIVANTTEFIVDKNRPFSRLGKAGSVFYNPETTILAETEEVVFDV